MYLRAAPLADSNDLTLESLVTRILHLKERLAKARTDHEKTILQREVEATDQNIDRRVYELYGLNTDEVAIVDAMKPRDTE